MDFYIGQQFEGAYPPEAAEWCTKHNAHIEKTGGIRTIVANPPPVITIQDYDDAMEEHLLAERVARGYTKREPSDYQNSTVPRWHQDAIDWIAHRDAVMIYGLEVENRFIETGEAPSLEEFKAALPRIVWTLADPEN